MKKFTIANYKGGVAKSTTAFELGWYLATRGLKVLMLDTDPQANLTEYLLAGKAPIGRSLPEILISGTPIDKSDINRRVIDAKGHCLDYVYSTIQLSRIERKIPDGSPKEYIIADCLSYIESEYNVIIIDTAPSAEILGLSSLIASNEVIIPTALDELSMSGTFSMIEMISKIKANKRLNPDIHLAGILITRYRRTLSTDFHGKRLSEKYGDLVIKPYIRESTKVQQAGNNHMSVSAHDPFCGSAMDYKEAFYNLFNNIKSKK